METIPTEFVMTGVMEDTTLESILMLVNQIADASVLMNGILVFFVVVILCYFVYKFFRIFF